MKLNFKYVALNEHEFELYNRFLNENLNSEDADDDSILKTDTDDEPEPEQYRNFRNMKSAKQNVKTGLYKSNFFNVRKDNEIIDKNRVLTIEQFKNAYDYDTEDGLYKCKCCDCEVENYDDLLRHFHTIHNTIVKSEIRQSYCVRENGIKNNDSLTHLFFCCQGDLDNHINSGNNALNGRNTNNGAPCNRCKIVKKLIENNVVTENTSLEEIYQKQEEEFKEMNVKYKLNVTKKISFEKLREYDVKILDYFKGEKLKGKKLNDKVEETLNKLKERIPNMDNLLEKLNAGYDDYDIKSIYEYKETVTNLLNLSKEIVSIEESLSKTLDKVVMNKKEEFNSKGRKYENEISRLSTLFECRKRKNNSFEKQKEIALFLNNEPDEILNIRKSILKKIEEMSNENLGIKEEGGSSVNNKSLQEVMLTYALSNKLLKNYSKVSLSHKNNNYLPDIYIETENGKKIIIEIDGPWHYKNRNKDYTTQQIIDSDKIRNNHFLKDGYSIIRVNDLDYIIGKPRMDEVLYEKDENNEIMYNEFKNNIDKRIKRKESIINELNEMLTKLIDEIKKNKTCVLFKINWNKNDGKLMFRKMN